MYIHIKQWFPKQTRSCIYFHLLSYINTYMTNARLPYTAIKKPQHIHAHIRRHAHIHTHMHVHVHICIYVCAYIYIYIYTHVYPCLVWRNWHMADCVATIPCACTWTAHAVPSTHMWGTTMNQTDWPTRRTICNMEQIMCEFKTILANRSC